MNEKRNAPDGWYDGKLACASVSDRDDGSLILELEFDVGPEYFWAKEGVWIRNAPSGDAQKDASRAQWTKDSIERIKEVYPEAVVNGKIVIAKLTGGEKDVADKTVRVRVTQSGEYVKAKVFAPKATKRRISREDSLKTASRYSRDLAKFGIAIDEPKDSVVVGTPDADASDIPF